MFYNFRSKMNFGPQLTVPVGDNPNLHVGSWQGLTIKEILEKVDLSNIIMDDEEKKVSWMYSNGKCDRQWYCNIFHQNHEKGVTMPSELNPESAFLGPKLWSRPVPMPITGDNDDFAVMNIDDFLSENGFDLDGNAAASPKSDDMDTDSNESHEVRPKKATQKRQFEVEDDEDDDDEPPAKSSNNAFLYVER